MGSVANEIDVFGEMYFANCTTPLEAVFTSDDTYYKITGLTVANQFNCTADGSDITIKYDGKYFISGSATVYPSGGAEIRFTVFNGSTPLSNLCGATDFSNNQDERNIALGGFADLLAGDVITIQGTSDTALRTAYIPNCNLSIMRMGL